MTIKKAITTSDAPAAIGPYSQAIMAGEMMFISGQLPLDPESGAMIEGDIGAKTEQILANAAAIAAAAGTSLNKTVKTTVFLTDLQLFARVNETYSLFFPENPPARSTVQVAALPLGSEIEIEFILIP
jgi:2-iminobutanoate/2-iminopropanoate deaminase